MICGSRQKPSHRWKGRRWVPSTKVLPGVIVVCKRHVGLAVRLASWLRPVRPVVVLKIKHLLSLRRCSFDLLGPCSSPHIGPGLGEKASLRAYNQLARLRLTMRLEWRRGQLMNKQWWGFARGQLSTCWPVWRYLSARPRTGTRRNTNPFNNPMHFWCWADTSIAARLEQLDYVTWIHMSNLDSILQIASSIRLGEPQTEGNLQWKKRNCTKLPRGYVMLSWRLMGH